MSGITRTFRNTHKGGKKASKRLKNVKRSNKSRTVRRARKMTRSKRSRRSRRVYGQNRKKLSRKARRSVRSGRSTSTRRNRRKLKGGSGAASDWMSSYNNSETASCPEGKIEVSWLDQAGITTPKDGINPQGIHNSLTTTFRQANENRSMDGSIGK